MTTLRLWALLRRRSRGDQRDPAALTSVLAVIAFGATTAVGLVVLGGLLAFIDRAATAGHENTSYPAETYVLLAAIAALLLLVPLTTLGAAAARLAMARRDARLAALRLSGATTGQVTVLTLLDATAQAALGALLGVGGYLALLPLVAQLRFQDRTFAVGELWVGVPAVLLAVLAVLLIAVASAATSLQRVAVTPLGVANRVRPPGLRAMRLLAVVVAFVALLVVNSGVGGAGTVMLVVLAGTVALGMATLNVVGPFLLGLIGRIVAKRASTAATLLAARRVADDPKTAWRSVGGIAIATFVAGMTAILALFPTDLAADPAERIFLTDIATGGTLTLAIAGVLAAVSTGVMQAGRVIDQRATYRSLALAGTETSVLDAARGRETLIPLLAAVGSATAAMLLFMVPIIGFASFVQPAVIVQFLLSVVAASALVLLGSAASRVVAHRMMAATD